MARTKIQLPDNFNFTAIVPIRITDINYGGHTGNDSILSILHEARVQFLRAYGYEETNMAGVGLIMSDVVIDFKNESFYGDTLTIQVTATNFERFNFDIFYKVETKRGEKTLPVANAKTGMVCFNYDARKIALIPEGVAEKLS